MKILILGGTAFFGRDLAERLLREGHAVAVMSRGSKPAPPGATHIKGDRRVGEDLARAAAAGPWDAVVDNIGQKGDEAVRALEAFTSRAHRLVFTSTLSVYSCLKGLRQPAREEDTDTHEIDEELKAKVAEDPGAAYCFGKRAAEAAYLAAHREGRVPVAIVRPGLVLGPRDPSHRAAAYWDRLLDGDPIPLPDGGQVAWRFAYSEDVADVLHRALFMDSAPGRAFNAVAREIVSLREFLDLSAEILHVTPSYESIPFSWLETQGFDWAGSPFADDKALLADMTRTTTILGHDPTPLSTWLPRAIQWYLDEGRRTDHPSGKGRASEIDLVAGWRTLLRGPDIETVT